MEQNTAHWFIGLCSMLVFIIAGSLVMLLCSFVPFRKLRKKKFPRVFYRHRCNESIDPGDELPVSFNSDTSIYSFASPVSIEGLDPDNIYERVSHPQNRLLIPTHPLTNVLDTRSAFITQQKETRQSKTRNLGHQTITSFPGLHNNIGISERRQITGNSSHSLPRNTIGSNNERTFSNTKRNPYEDWQKHRSLSVNLPDKMQIKRPQQLDAKRTKWWSFSWKDRFDSLLESTICYSSASQVDSNEVEDDVKTTDSSVSNSPVEMRNQTLFDGRRGDIYSIVKT